MSAPNRNTLWARTLADELGRQGLVHVCVGSGSRSAPLVEAFATDDRFAVHPHVDERSAGFFALGIAAASGRPAAVVTTSGTATANLLPAVVEASHSDIPLIVLTADRPAILRGLDANQTIDQVRLFGPYPRATIDLPLPRPRVEDLRLLRVAAGRIWAAATGTQGSRGPVHANVQFEKPLEPTPVESDGLAGLDGTGVTARTDGGPWVSVSGSAPGLAAGEARRLAGRIATAERPLFVCGPLLAADVGPAVLRAAAATGVPVLADPLSGARFGPGASDSVVAWGDAVLSSATAVEVLRPDLVVRAGPAATSGPVNRFLDALAGVDQIVIDDGARWKDHLGLGGEYVHADVGAAFAAIAGEAMAADGTETHEAGGPHAAWRALWQTASDTAGEVLEPRLADPERWFEGSIAAAAARAVPAGGTLFVGNSMPIRDVDAFAPPTEKTVRALGFRGASGIDGNISGALGACAGSGTPTLALIGDLTLLHDVGALFAAQPPRATVQIVVVQNRGGGIFHMLPIREFDPPFTKHVVMPHDVDIGAVAGAAGIPHRLTASIADLEDELASGWVAGGLRIVEIRTDREENWTHRRAAVGAASAAVSERLTAR